MDRDTSTCVEVSSKCVRVPGLVSVDSGLSTKVPSSSAKVLGSALMAPGTSVGVSSPVLMDLGTSTRDSDTSTRVRSSALMYLSPALMYPSCGARNLGTSTGVLGLILMDLCVGTRNPGPALMDMGAEDLSKGAKDSSTRVLGLASMD